MCVCVRVHNGTPVCLLQQGSVMTVVTVGGAPRRTQLRSAVCVRLDEVSCTQAQRQNRHSASVADVTHSNELPGVTDLELIFRAATIIQHN